MLLQANKLTAKYEAAPKKNSIFFLKKFKNSLFTYYYIYK